MIHESESQRYVDIRQMDRIARILDSSTSLKKYFGDWNHRYITGELIPKAEGPKGILRKGWDWMRKLYSLDREEELERLLTK
jgi:hypothetical protein